MSKLVIWFDTEKASIAYRDHEIEPICRQTLESTILGETQIHFITAQELVVQMFRALLYKEYKSYQQDVSFLINGEKVIYDSNMRNASGIYPPSVYDKCLCILLGATDE